MWFGKSQSEVKYIGRIVVYLFGLGLGTFLLMRYNKLYFKNMQRLSSHDLDCSLKRTI